MSHQKSSQNSYSDAGNITINSRESWNASESKLIERFNGPIPFVIIHHSYIPAACETSESCMKAMRSMQSMHQLEKGWNDIGYSFAIGGNGEVYQGRGFNVVGAHAPRYNANSIGICMIGDWRSEFHNSQGNLFKSDMLSNCFNFLKFSLPISPISDFHPSATSTLSQQAYRQLE